MKRIRLICPLFALLLLCPAFNRANADSMTYSGTFTADDSVFSQIITVASTQVYNFYTTSYVGGVNLVGPASLSGGFAPVLTLFSDATGQVVQ